MATSSRRGRPKQATYGPWMNKIKSEDYIKNPALKVGGTGLEGRYADSPETSKELHEKAAKNVVKLRQRREEEQNPQQPPLRRAA